eukprot:363916-Chlamydomonas_euryale.AAC.2
MAIPPPHTDAQSGPAHAPHHTHTRSPPTHSWLLTPPCRRARGHTAGGGAQRGSSRAPRAARPRRSPAAAPVARVGTSRCRTHGTRRRVAPPRTARMRRHTPRKSPPSRWRRPAACGGACHRAAAMRGGRLRQTLTRASTHTAAMGDQRAGHRRWAAH